MVSCVLKFSFIVVDYVHCICVFILDDPGCFEHTGQ